MAVPGRREVDCLVGPSCGVLEAVGLAVGETVILLHLPLPLVSVSIAMERELQQNDSLVMAKLAGMLGIQLRVPSVCTIQTECSSDSFTRQPTVSD